ncbi:MAG TPA: general stress protein, partial [Solirubrobacteraceae bacterium]|nr:general stress protein [Solirubrobacteraceae bacterium]
MREREVRSEYPAEGGSMTVEHDEARAARPARETIATFASYQEAERAVDWLSDRGFAVERVSIVGTGISLVEQVTGRVTTARAALNGAAQGAFVALLFMLLVVIFFTVAEGFWV